MSITRGSEEGMSRQRRVHTLIPCISSVESEIRPARLLTWCQKQTEGYRNVTVTDLTSSWQSGTALCALIHKFKPQLMYVTHKMICVSSFPHTTRVSSLLGCCVSHCMNIPFFELCTFFATTSCYGNAGCVNYAWY